MNNINLVNKDNNTSKMQNHELDMFSEFNTYNNKKEDNKLNSQNEQNNESGNNKPGMERES